MFSRLCWAGVVLLIGVDSTHLSPPLCPLMLCYSVETRHSGNIYTTEVGQHHNHEYIIFPPRDSLPT